MWTIIEQAHGDAEIVDRKFTTLRDAVFYSQCTHDTEDRPTKIRPGTYELHGDVLTTDPSDWMEE